MRLRSDTTIRHSRGWPPPRGRGRGVRFVVALALSLSAPAAAQDARHVLVIYPSHSTQLASRLIDSAFRAEMRRNSGDAIEVFSEYLDLARFPGPEQEERMAALLAAKYGGLRLDLVVAAGDPALTFALARRSRLYAGVPFIFSAITEDNPRLKELPSDVAGILVHLDVVPTLNLALRLQPDARRIVLVSGASPIDQGWATRAAASLRSSAPPLETVAIAGLPIDETLARLRRIPRDSIVLMVTFTRDGAGRYFLTEDAAARAASASAAPIYSASESMFGSGVVGGHVETFEGIGRDTAALALRVLSGERPSMPIARAPDAFVPHVDVRAMRRWGLDEARLPPGSVLHFREPSLWEEHRWSVIAALIVVLAQATMITGLIVQRRLRRRAEALTRLAERRADEQRRELTHLARVATLGELSGAMAHELNQPLTAILSNAQAAQRLMARPEPDLAEIRAILADIVTEDRRAGDVIAHLRRLLRKDETRLDPLDLNELVVDTIHLLHSELLARGVKATTELAEDLPPVMGDRIQLQQVLLNLIGNACDAMDQRPAGERRLAVATGPEPDGGVRLAVRDEGQGIAEAVATRLFQPFVTSKPNGLGLGLSICRSIVEAHGGKLAAFNNADRGATFSVALPARAEAAE